jgi:beta-galactosidase
VTKNRDSFARVRNRDSLDFDWRFALGDPAGAEKPEHDDSAWRELSLPHDFSIEGPFTKDAAGGGSNGFAPGGVGWYRKRLELGARDLEGARWVEFDGVYQQSDVWLNGRHLGRRDYGYSSFHYDLGGHARAGENVLAVRVDNSNQPNCRWYSGSGIYRHVWLVRTGRVHVEHWGTYVTTPWVSKELAEARVRTRVRSVTPGVEIEIETKILDPEQREVGAETARANSSAEPRTTFLQTLRVEKPRLWSLDERALYSVKTVVRVGGVVTDELVTPFGIRTARFDAARGFLLNGESIKLKGVCLHHDGGAVGAAVPERVLERRLEILREFGCNAIRTAHNPPAPDLLDLCDRMGFLVIDEAFDKWQGLPEEAWWMKSTSFAAEWEQDLRAMLERDANHPSIVLYSVGNETGEPGSAAVDETIERLVEFVHREEPSRQVTCALVLPRAKTFEERVEGVLSSARLMDVLGVNYQEPLYDAFHDRAPEVPLLGTETFKYYRSSPELRTGFDPKNPWYDVADHDWVAGQFLWVGIDYLGESNRWPLRGYPSGLFDTCCFARPEAWFHRSVWRSEPIVKIAVFSAGTADVANAWYAPTLAPHYNFAEHEGKLLRLQTQTNCESVELIVNGVSQGERRSADFLNRAVIWLVPWAPGSVEAVGRNGGVIVVRDALRTSGPPARLELVADRLELAADGRDVSHVEARIVDEHGVLVPNADRLLEFELEGPGRLIGVDNGDLECEEPYQGRARTSRSGRCLAIVQVGRRPGRLALTVKAADLPAARIALSSR